MTEHYQIRKGEKLEWALYVRHNQSWTVLLEHDNLEFLQKRMKTLTEQKTIRG